MASFEVSSEAAMQALHRAVERARSGFRRDVRALIEALRASPILIPLARRLAGIPAGGAKAVDGELQISPHLLPTSDGRRAVCLFTHEAPLARIVGPNGWKTDAGPLELAALPALDGFRLAYRMIDNWNVICLVIDPGAPSELRLTSAEIGALLDGQAIPLLSYAAHAPIESVTLQVEAAPEQARAALDACLAAQPSVLEYRFERLFDPERQLEPRLTVRLRVGTVVEQEPLVRAISAAISGKVPEGVTIDVRFDL